VNGLKFFKVEFDEKGKWASFFGLYHWIHQLTFTLQFGPFEVAFLCFSNSFHSPDLLIINGKLGWEILGSHAAIPTLNCPPSFADEFCLVFT
jgi:hypothetical protein